MKMRFFLGAVLACASLCLPSPLWAEDKIKIVTTTSTFASITQSIARGRAEIYTIASPNQDVHFITPTPKDVLKTKKAGVFIHGGLDLEIWRNPLLDASGRADFINQERAIDCSKEINLINVPQHGHLSRLQGDVHIYGNPHYWLDPENGKGIARNIAEGLSSLYPEQAEFFRKNLADFVSDLETKIQDWQNRLSVFKGEYVVPYHNSWPYFIERFGLKTLDHLEPKPGIPPTPKHIKNVIEEINVHKAKVIIRQIFHESRTPKKVAEKTGIKTVLLVSEPGEIKSDYPGMFEHNVRQLEEALKN